VVRETVPRPLQGSSYLVTDLVPVHELGQRLVVSLFGLKVAPTDGAREGPLGFTSLASFSDSVTLLEEDLGVRILVFHGSFE
jgi:hypothetical protein